MANSINSDLLLTDYRSQAKTTGNSVLGKDDFLRILITQLQNQDPSNPMQDREFIAQMAQFSSLEQMTNMNKTMEHFLGMQADTMLFQHSQMIGKEVSYEAEEKKEDGTAQIIVKEGKVKSVFWENGQTKLELTDGTKIESLQIIKVSDSASS
ncbi:flagellar hook assembly protein FlgD [Fictibacillus aquaticus]|uniref:Flagellar hook assembly protein FlgD n=1 Tax=Fictibacillus aquaticus TaxID=2021314 RepID=A0A235FD55_9BACL|nr:flagellar hook assembly protein FlgD [Fictibacillus aquaticus]OYD58853.1 flagellar hook assembly protein FlgD [Fictibacillus aquaticus]